MTLALRRRLATLPALLFCLLLSLTTQAATPARLAVVIDDLGQHAALDARVMALPGPIGMAIMPDTPHAASLARTAHRAGHTLLLHLPMDPATGPFAWHPGMPRETLEQRLQAALEAVPYVSGVNNHMGSRMTADGEAMAWLMEDLQRRGLFFLDSRTSAATQGAAQAQRIGLASLSRDVFLDNDPSERAIDGQLDKALELARREGSAVVIGHPYPSTLAVLERRLPKLAEQGVEWIDIEQMIALRSNRAMPAHGHDGIYTPAQRQPRPDGERRANLQKNR